MSAPTRPTIVLIPGAFHPATCYELLLPHLHALSFPTRSIAPPSLNAPPPSLVAVAEDAAFIRDTILQPLLDEGKDVVLFAHSYSGVPACAAPLGMSRTTRRRKGEEGGVIGVVCLAAFLVREGEEALVALGGGDPVALRRDHPAPNLSTFSQPERFYHDVPRPLAATFISTLLPHSYLAFHSPSPKPAFLEEDFTGRFAYIKCTEDVPVSFARQEELIRGTGVGWVERSIESGHSPFANRPEELAGIMGEVVAVFEGVE
ncbi:hypothetical protein BJ875DRAFT_517460 [Amylocarpus encephaloides]|uniref:AB hydrolase-1 domain-containing protein n=1 Tax=Amylocarpus encephaloides TaxID=45428 RepID=A0A9P8C3U9_9HELO|nr:hypothetical protein BJ875DRAFT_517460 [Amylocarpus encephaloides]